MKSKISFLAALLGLASFAYFWFTGKPETGVDQYVVFNTFSTVTGECYQNKVLESDIQKMPQWSPEDRSPPISVKQALESARNYIKNKRPALIGANISQIQYARFKTPAFTVNDDYYSNKWCYIISFRSGDTEMAQVVVQMDGKINESEIVRFDKQ